MKTLSLAQHLWMLFLAGPCQDADDEATEVIAAAIPTNSNLQALTADDSASAAASAGAAAIKAVARSSTLPLPRLLLLGLTKRGDKHWILGAPRLLAGVEKLITWASQQYTKSAMQGLADALPAMPKLRCCVGGSIKAGFRCMHHLTDACMWSVTDTSR